MGEWGGGNDCGGNWLGAGQIGQCGLERLAGGAAASGLGCEAACVSLQKLV